jgi:hypothetical protein
MLDRKSVENADLIIVTSNSMEAYSSVGRFYDNGDGIYFYLEEFETAKNKCDYIHALSYCEFIYLLFYWCDNNTAEFAYLSEDSINRLKRYRELDFPELSSDFFEFDWYNSLCNFEDIVWQPNFAWGIGTNGELFLLNTEWDIHNLYIRQNSYTDFTIDLDICKKELCVNFF